LKIKLIKALKQEIDKIQKRIYRFFRNISRAGKRHKVSFGIVIVCLLIGYGLVWGIYYFSVQQETKPERTYVLEPPKPVVKPVKTTAKVAIILDDAGGDFVNYEAIY